MSKNAVTPSLLGGNVLFHRNLLKSGGIDDAFKELGLKRVRYPGGSITEKVFNLDDPNDPVLRYGTMTYPDGFLKLSDFATWASSEKFLVNFVIPTYFAINVDTSEIIQSEINKIVKFVKLLLDKNGQFKDLNVETIEIGNEYWGNDGISAHQYSKILSVLIDKIYDVIVKTKSNTKILVQLGQPWGKDFEISGDLYHSKKWNDKLQSSNEMIISELSSDQLKKIGGLVHHLYVGRKRFIADDGVMMYENIKNDLAVMIKPWRKSGCVAPLAITEWNIGQDQLEFGLSSASLMLELFEQIVKIDAKYADVWPVQLNSRYDLAGDPGKLTKTFAGEIMKMCVRLNGYFSKQMPDGFVVERNVWENDDFYIVHIISRSENPQTVSLEHVSHRGQIESANILGYDPSTVDGKDWRPDQNNAPIENWYDHGAKPKWRNISPKLRYVDLQPFEILEMKISKKLSMIDKIKNYLKYFFKKLFTFR